MNCAFDCSLPSSTPRPTGKRLGSSATADSSDLSMEVQKLQEQVSGYEQEIEQFELIKSDWEMEKDALQEVLLKLRLQLKEKEDQLLVMQSKVQCTIYYHLQKATDLCAYAQSIHCPKKIRKLHKRIICRVPKSCQMNLQN